ncbi:hypothetical protein N0V86_001852 [Didymella sp. IMI 355093]|nr:hypothetical protein N0V86_001852 [Didymella sp. IMI 355093]
MAILLTGGSGKTSTRLASLLHTHNVDFLLASRNPSSSITPDNYVKFDWTDSSTWPTAFRTPIRAVYMMEPQAAQPWIPMISFLDFAISKGATRFVLCAGTTAERGKDGMGRVWDAFVERGVEFCVLRPSWFMENLVEPGLVYTITQLGKIFTACQDGEIPFVSADDIAEVAYYALTNEKSYDGDLRVLGPELLTYDGVAARLTAALGRPVEHVKLDRQGRYENLVQAGLSDYFAQFFTNVEVKASEGLETALNSDVKDVTGHPPKSLDDFIRENGTAWAS